MVSRMVPALRAPRDRSVCGADALGGPATGAESGDQAVLAAAADIGSERDGLVLPGGVECRQIARIGIGLVEQHRYLLGFRLGSRERYERAEGRFVGGAALAQPL